MHTIASPFARAFATAAVLSALAFATPSYAVGSSSNSTPKAQGSMGNAVEPVSAGSSTGGKQYNAEDAAQRLETRIQTLHDKLKITPEQESEWGDVAQAMRDNESGIGEQIEARQAGSKTMSAVEDLQSYQKIAQAHADGMTKVISSFSTLYDDMSDDQKKNADQVFGQYEGHRGMAKASAHKKSGAGSSSSSSSD
jgi:hypothetical protein